MNTHTITIDSLIDELTALKSSGYDGDTSVVIGYPYGDYTSTTAAGSIEYVEPASLKESAYSDSGFSINEDDGTESDKGDVIVLWDPYT